MNDVLCIEIKDFMCSSVKTEVIENREDFLNLLYPNGLKFLYLGSKEPEILTLTGGWQSACGSDECGVKGSEKIDCILRSELSHCLLFKGSEGDGWVAVTNDEYRERKRKLARHI